MDIHQIGHLNYFRQSKEWIDQVFPECSKGSIFLLAEPKCNFFDFFGPDQRAEQIIPNGQPRSHVGTVVLFVIAVVDLMLIGTDKYIFQKIEVLQLNVGMPEIGTEKEKDEVQYIDTQKGYQAYLFVGQVKEYPCGHTFYKNSSKVVDDQFQRVDAVLRKRIQYGCGMMNFMKFPQKWHPVHEVMGDKAGKVIDDNNCKRIQNGK